MKIQPTLTLLTSLFAVGSATAAVITGGLNQTTTSTIDVVLTDNNPLNDPDIGADGWRVWDTTTAQAGSDAKSGSNSIGSYTFLGGLTAGDMGTASAGAGAATFDYAWVDGTPTATDGLVAGTDNGILQTATAAGGLTDGQGLGVPVTLTGSEGSIGFWVGVRRTNAKLLVRDSGSNILYDSSTVSQNLDASTTGSQVLAGEYLFDYTGATIGETLTLEWVNDGADNNAQLQLGAAAEHATVIPEPQTVALVTALGALGLVLLRRRSR